MNHRIPVQINSHYPWVVLSNTTLGTLIASINGSIILISLPSIFRSLGVDPLASGQSVFLLWILIGYTLVTAVLLVTCGRISDMFGRVKFYNLGCVIFTAFSLALVFVPNKGGLGAVEILVPRLLQGGGGAGLRSSRTSSCRHLWMACTSRFGFRRRFRSWRPSRLRCAAANPPTQNSAR